MILDALNALHFDFQYPWVLTLFLLSFGIIYYAAVRKSPALQMPTLRAIPHTPRFWNTSRHLPLLCYACALWLLIFALSGPRLRSEIQQPKFNGVDIVLAIDLSGSMSYRDIPHPSMNEHQIRQIPTRLELCKKAIDEFITQRPNDRIGLIAFADQAYSICPPTRDHQWLKGQVADMKLGTAIGQGTGIAAPIASAIERTKHSEAKRKLMVLFTDGSNTIRNPLSPIQAAELADSEYQLSIYTVGIGSNQAVAEANSFFGGRYVPVQSEFDESLLKNIAQKTKGKYYSATDQEGMKAALKEIDKIEKVTDEIPPLITYHSWAAPCAALSLLFAFAGYILGHTLFLRYP